MAHPRNRLFCSDLKKFEEHKVRSVNHGNSNGS
jgi:hypothetical protein